MNPLASAIEMAQNPKPVISGILLAAGLSTRMGEPKQLLPFGESTIVETVVDRMLDSTLDEVIVVIGHCGEQVRKKINELPVQIVFNANYREGMLSSAQCGVRALGDATDAFALMLVDQPFITSALIDTVIGAYAQTEKGIAVPSYNYRRGHPAIFHRRYAEDILALGADSDGVRTLFKTCANDIHYVIVDTDWVLRDIDYREDYERALRDKK